MKHLVFISVFILVSVTGCKKPPGEGGQALIRGKVWVEDWNAAFTIKNGEYAGYDREVYIVYGEHAGFDERIRADYNGEFEFRYLRKGKYRIYVYSKDKTLTTQSGDTTFVQEVEITKKKETLTLNNFTIYE